MKNFKSLKYPILNSHFKIPFEFDLPLHFFIHSLIHFSKLIIIFIRTSHFIFITNPVLFYNLFLIQFTISLFDFTYHIPSHPIIINSIF